MQALLRAGLAGAAGVGGMSDAVFAGEPWVRLGAFLGVFAVMAGWEVLAPRRVPALGRGRRWPGNLGLVVVDTVAVRLLFPLAAVGVALLAARHGWGVLRLLRVPEWAAVVVGVVGLDLAIYAQHVAFHRVPVLWRLHRTHHADTEFDVSTGLRFHPGEVVLSMVIKGVVVVALGAPALAVLVFEVVLNAGAMFSHGNVRLPGWLDAALRRGVVTPDMHRVHHSVVRAETDSNFGFNLAVWDRVFGTYRAAPAAGQDGMVIGLPGFRGAGESRLDRLLVQPWRAAE